MSRIQNLPQQYPSPNLKTSNSQFDFSSDISHQIQALDHQNRKLIVIAENIMKTSFIRQAQQTPAVILQLQEDMKLSFNTLIESIRDFFMSIDSKLKEIGVAMESKMGEKELYSSRNTVRGENDKIDMLMMRMACMEGNIKKSQQNQAKLIMIIEEMNNKRNSYEEQPTIRKDSDCRMVTANSTEENSFRLFSMNAIPDNNQCKRVEIQPQQQTYKKFQQYSNSPVVDSMGPFNQRTTPELPQFFCGASQQREEAKGPKKNMNYFKQNANVPETPGFEYESSNRIHRLSNLLKGLKD